jgi:hypothetical protein
MAEVTIDLQEGFFDDTLVVRHDGQEVARRDGLRTRMQTGFAHQFELDLPPGATALEIVLPAKDIAALVQLPPERPLWIGVSLDAGRLQIRVAREAFGYL